MRKKFGGWNGNEIFQKKKCPICGDWFQPHSGVHKYCSPQCKGRQQYVSGVKSTENQYIQISGNWKRYVSRLLYGACVRNRYKNPRADLDRDFLLRLLARQKYLCALSGVELTCQLQKGTMYWTNASIDRIDSSKGYTPDNIRFVCAVVNKMRLDNDDETFLWWCNQLVRHNNEKKTGLQG